MVASRWPWRLDFLSAAIKRSISAVVRYSRVRTEEFTVVGADRPPLRFSTIFCPRSNTTGELSTVSSLVSIGAVGIHGQPWADAQSPEPPAREALRASCHVALGRPPTGSSELRLSSIRQRLLAFAPMVIVSRHGAQLAFVGIFCGYPFRDSAARIRIFSVELR